MKTKFTTMATVMGLSSIALANAGTAFTPVEELSPELRQEVLTKVSEATKGADVDWENVVIGVNDAGEIVFMLRTGAGLQPMASPSTFGAFSKPDVGQ